MPLQRCRFQSRLNSSASSWINVRSSIVASSVDVLVRRDGQELDELVAQRDLLEQRARLVQPRDAVELLSLLVDRAAHVLLRDTPVAQPLPDLRARDLGRRRV